MTRIIHLSDLHFGLHHESVVTLLLEKINQLNAEMVVVTGDLTHRARPGQFKRAADFLDAINAPIMVVPGNHDIPLYNLPARLYWPYSGYEKAINHDLAPAQTIGELKIWGYNSVNPLSWRAGVLRHDEIIKIAAQFDPNMINIVAVHHPLQQLPHAEKELARGAAEAIAQLEAAGADIVLSGHLHEWVVEELLALGSNRILQIQSGTGLCARNPARHNEFALLDISRNDVFIERYIFPVGGTEFSDAVTSRFSRNADVWKEVIPNKNPHR